MCVYSAVARPAPLGGGTISDRGGPLHTFVRVHCGIVRSLVVAGGGTGHRLEGHGPPTPPMATALCVYVCVTGCVCVSRLHSLCDTTVVYNL
jgi:nitrate/nitrite transporter NarK